MNIQLTKFQQEGVNFLSSHPHAILADDCGLGKTYQVAFAIAAIRKAGDKVAIIAPKNTHIQWKETLTNSGVVLGGVRILSNSLKSIKEIDSDRPDILVIDEAHEIGVSSASLDWIKGAVQTCPIVWFLSATWMKEGRNENAYIMWLSCVYPTLNPKYCQCFTEFRRMFSVGEWTRNYFKWKGNANDELFHQSMSPFVLRRTIDDVPGFPIVRFEKYERKLHDESNIRNAINRVCDDNGKTLQLATRLLAAKVESAKCNTAITTDFIAHSDGNQKYIVFTEYLESVAMLKNDRTMVVTGNTKDAAMQFKRFKEINEFNVLVTTFKACNCGVDFPQVDTVVFNDLPYSATALQQAISRISRLSSNSKIKNAIIICRGTLLEYWLLAIVSDKFKEIAKFVPQPILQSFPTHNRTKSQAISQLFSYYNNGTNQP